jgi:hypothetical protein
MQRDHRLTGKPIRVSQQLIMGITICTLVVVATCLLWSSNTFALTAGSSECTKASQAVLNFFVHDDLDITPIGSAFLVVPQLSNPNSLHNNNLFGSIAVFDDKVTTTGDVNSLEIARGRGFYVFDHLANDSTSLEFVLTTIFNNQSGYEDGSSIVMRGYDDITQVYRELAIVGGTGTFRLARGWAGILTYSANGGSAVLNFTAHVYYGCEGGVSVSGSSQIVPSYYTMLNIGLCAMVLHMLSPLVSTRRCQ